MLIDGEGVDRRRAALLWTLSRGGVIDAKTQDGSAITLRRISELPEMPITVRRIDLFYGQPTKGYLEKLTELREASELCAFNAAVDSDRAAQLKAMTSLESLMLSGNPLSDGAMPAVGF